MTGSQQIGKRRGRAKGAEAREQNVHTNTDRNTHTGDKTKGWQEESSRIPPVGQSYNSKPRRAAKIQHHQNSDSTSGTNISSLLQYFI